jgi:hypothetical protein
MSAEIFSKQILVCGSTVTVFSVDRWRWFSNRAEALQYAAKWSKIWDESKKSMKRQGTYLSTNGERRRRRRREES